MGSIIACCGHDITEEFRNGINTDYVAKSFYYEEDGFHRAISYGCACPKCLEQYEEWGVLLHGRTEEESWMNGTMSDDGLCL
jgi:hypothetical protein